jgi:hypothetical protein
MTESTASKQEISNDIRDSFAYHLDNIADGIEAARSAMGIDSLSDFDDAMERVARNVAEMRTHRIRDFNDGVTAPEPGKLATIVLEFSRL